ncbi:hypothetical protein ACJRO7_022463 [Eucalyptus globulus]|uniref:Cytochrome P450 n=1 Tax=Eucalyptus globulus TaxID=34317 RepID=A0ABD3KBI8_EUCGL
MVIQFLLFVASFAIGKHLLRKIQEVIRFLLLLAFYTISKRLLHDAREVIQFLLFLASLFPALPVIGHLYLLQNPHHRSPSCISRWHGPITLLRFGSHRVLIVSSLDPAEECLTKNDVVFANQPHLLVGKHLGYNYTSLTWSPYGSHWRKLRYIASLEMLSTNRLLTLSSIRANEVNGGQSVNVKSTFFELKLNAMMQMIAGKRYYGENVGESEEEINFREIVTESSRIGHYENGPKGMEEKLMALQKKRDEFMQSLIDESRTSGDHESPETADGGKKKTLIQVLLSLQETEPEYYKDEVIKSLTVALSAMLNHPKILKKAQAEIDEVVGHNRLVSKSDLPKLPYLHSIIKETMQMYPVGPLLVPHESVEGCHIGGYRIPRGTMLLINLLSIQNDPKYWPDVTKFKPERFKGKEGARDGYKMMPLGSGRRGCPGENPCFEWNRITEESIDMTEGTGLTMPKAQPLLAKCRPNSFTSALLSQA